VNEATPFKLECLAVVYCAQEFHQFLCHGGRHFTIHIDHQALVALKDHSKRQQTLGSWLVTLLEYDFATSRANKISYRTTSRAFMNALASGGYQHLLAAASTSDGWVIIPGNTTKSSPLESNQCEHRSICKRYSNGGINKSHR